jgi:hypothetical protein
MSIDLGSRHEPISAICSTWVKLDTNGDFTASDRTDPNSFIETISLETLYPQQIALAKTAQAATY